MSEISGMIEIYASTPSGPQSDPPEARARANAEYQKVLLALLNLATALVAAPPFFLRDLYGVAHKDQPIGQYLNGWMYTSWISFGACILGCLIFQYASAKWLKKAYGGSVSWQVSKIEGLLNWSFRIGIISFVVGLSCLMIFVASVRS